MSENLSDSGLVERKQRLSRAVITEELVTLTGDMVLGVLLRQFIYWCVRVKDVDAYLAEERDRLVVSDVELAHRINPLMSGGWVYKTAAEIKHEIMFTGGDSTLAKHLAALSNTPWLERRNNPKHAWDKTWQYRVDLVQIETDLRKIGYSLTTVMGEEYPFESSSSTNEKSLSTNEKALPETTPKTTSNKIGAVAPAKKVRKQRTPDPRSQHPIIQAIRAITGRYPSKTQYDPLIGAVGDKQIKEELLKKCHDDWVLKGWNETNLGWVTDWYCKGGPQGYGAEQVKPQLELVKEKYVNPYTGEVEYHMVGKAVGT